jgi:hypothetical protein
MDKSAEERTPREAVPATGKAKLIFRGAALAATLMLVLCTCLRLLLSSGQNTPADAYLRELVLVSAFGVSLACWGLFFLDIMCGFLRLAQAKLLPFVLDLFLALLSLLPLAVVLASHRLASGFGP